MNFLSTFSEAASTNGDIFSTLGIDWRLLILQIVAFLVLVWALGKFVYPWLMKSVDDHQKNLRDAAKAAQKAQQAAATSQAETQKLLDEARGEAAKIVSTAKLEASEMLTASEAKARLTAEAIAADAQTQISHSIDKARRELHDETLNLIALATEKVTRQKFDSKADEKLIADILKEAK